MAVFVKLLVVGLCIAASCAMPPQGKGMKGQQKKLENMLRKMQRKGGHVPQSVLDFLAAMQNIPQLPAELPAVETPTEAPPAPTETEAAQEPPPAGTEAPTDPDLTEPPPLPPAPAPTGTVTDDDKREVQARKFGGENRQHGHRDRGDTRMPDMHLIERLAGALSRVISRMNNPPPALSNLLADLQALLVEPAEATPTDDSMETTTETPGPGKRGFRERRGARGLMRRLDRLEELLEDLLEDVPADSDLSNVLQAALLALEEAELGATVNAIESPSGGASAASGGVSAASGGASAASAEEPAAEDAAVDDAVEETTEMP